MSKYLDDSGLGYFWSQLKAKLAAKQDTLVSGTNIKTVNNESLLGSGNISISGGTSNIFIATYRGISHADVLQAWQAGKDIIAFVDISQGYVAPYYLTRVGDGNDRPFRFVRMNKNAGATTAYSFVELTSAGWSEVTTVSLAELDSPTFMGTPKAPTASSGTNTTQIATTAFVQTALGSKAPLASPTFTGTPKAPTASSGTNTTQIATTAFVQGEIDSITPSDISAAPLYSGPFLNAGTASYRIFGHATLNTTNQASPFQFLVGSLSSMTGTNQGLYLVEGSNRNSSVSIRITALRKTGASNFTFGYYITSGEYYLGVYTSTTYANNPKILVMQNSPRCPWTFDDSIEVSSTAPSGWTTISSGALATTDDIDTAIGAALLASY